jgi:hypothetical protein
LERLQPERCDEQLVVELFYEVIVMVRAKFVVDSVSKTRWGNSVRLTPVYGDSEENKRFFSATPSGLIELNVVDDGIAKQFEVGKEYYIDFSPATE